jgi:PucR C-terminal helix-turn-helix domain
MSRTRRTLEEHRQRRDELLDRLLHDPDEAAVRDLTHLERLPHDVRIQVENPRRAGGWPLPDGTSVHIVSTRPRLATSGAALPLIDLREAVRRAKATRRAVAAGARPDPATWDGLGAWRLVVEAPDTLSVADLHPGAEILASRTRTDLTATARTVLDHGGDVTAAASALHLHRTTVYYRLARIEELTGVDLRDGTARVDLQLALWLQAYRRAGA